MKNTISAVTLTLLFAVNANAQSVSEAANAITQGWSGSASLGASSASGNAESSSVSGDIRLGKTVNRWEHLVFGSVFKGSSTLLIEERDDVTGEVVLDDTGRPVRRIVKGNNSDRFALGYQPKFYWKPNTYLFGILDWETDEPANIDSSTRQIIGIGHRFYSTETGYLTGEVGLGNKSLNQVFGPNLDGGIGYLGLNFVQKFSENGTFNVDFRSDFGDANTFIEIGLGLAFRVSERMRFKISHFTRNNSDIKDASNPLSSNGDSITSMNLVFDI